MTGKIVSLQQSNMNGYAAKAAKTRANAKSTSSKLKERVNLKCASLRYLFLKLDIVSQDSVSPFLEYIRRLL